MLYIAYGLLVAIAYVSFSLLMRYRLRHQVKVTDPRFLLAVFWVYGVLALAGAGLLRWVSEFQS